MGKTHLRGGGFRSPFSPSVIDQSILIRRIDSLWLSSSSDPDFIIQRFREHYPDYARVKLRPFSARLREVLQYLHSRYNKSAAVGDTSQPSYSSGGTDGEKPSRKKRGREDVLEECLQRAEFEHLRRCQSTKVAFSSSSKSSDDSTSTSDDAAAFDENIEPKLDITKSMLREKYVKQAEQSIKKGDKEKNVEIEAVIDDKRKTAFLMKNGGVIGKDVPFLGPRAGCTDFQSDAVSESGGPRFHDIGGMKGIVEELMMEVIVPLYHPDLPRRLGVRPMFCILLHGPLGCG